jgi:predicted MarR family transcription regulator
MIMAKNIQDAFQHWRQECQAIQEEMDSLLRAVLLSDIEQAQRRKRFAELIQRREAAARQILPPRKPSNFDQADEGFKTAV